MARPVKIFGMILLGINFKKGGARGFTLIELLLYVSVAAVIVSVVSGFLITMLQSRTKNQVIVEVEQEGVQVLQLMTQTTRNAEGINSPSSGTSASSASLDVVAVAKDPTVFDLSGSGLRVQEGGGAPLVLTSSRVLASDLLFQNLSRPNTPGTLRVQFTLTYANPENRSEYAYSKTFLGSASLR